MATRVYSYGARRPTSNADEVHEHVYRANRYRNDLTALERRRRERVADLLRRHFPRIGELETAVADAEKAVEDLQASIRKANSERRSRQVKAEDKAHVVAAKERRNGLYAALKAERAAAFGPEELKELRKNLALIRERLKRQTKKRDVTGQPEYQDAAEPVRRAESAWFALVPQAMEFSAGLRRIEDETNAAAKEIRANCGVHFGTYLAVEAAAKKFRSGPPPRFKPFRGDGSVGVQPPPNTKLRDILDATKGQVAIDGYRPDAPDAAKQRVNVRLRIGSDDSKKPIWTDVPVQLHRPLPEDAKVTWAYLVRRRVGTLYQHRMQFTLDREAERWTKPNLADRGVVAIDVGWRLVKGGMRTAYWIGDDGREGEIILPDKLLRRMEIPNEIQSQRKLALAAILPVFVAWYKSLANPPEWLVKRTHKTGEDGLRRFNAHQWESQGRLAGVVLEWENNRLDGDADIFRRLDRWRHLDAKEWNKEAHGRQKAIGWRDEIYKVFAAKLRTEYRTLRVENINWSKMQETPEAEKDTKDRLLGNYRTAACGRLIEILTKNMVETVRVDPKDTTRIHAGCGELSGETNPEHLFHTCAGCGVTFDQDQNSAMNLLAQHRPLALV